MAAAQPVAADAERALGSMPPRQPCVIATESALTGAERLTEHASASKRRLYSQFSGWQLASYPPAGCAQSGGSGRPRASHGEFEEGVGDVGAMLASSGQTAPPSRAGRNVNQSVCLLS